MGTDITSVKHDDFTKNTKLEMLHTLMAINDIITLSDNRDDIESACCRHSINTDRLYALFLPEEHHKGKPAARFAKRTGTASRNDSPAEAFYLDVFNELPSDEVLAGMPTDAYDTMVYILEHPVASQYFRYIFLHLFLSVFGISGWHAGIFAFQEIPVSVHLSLV